MVRSNTGKNNKLIIFWTGAIDNDVWGNNENFHCRGATLVGHKTNHKKIISCPNWPGRRHAAAGQVTTQSVPLRMYQPLLDASGYLLAHAMRRSLLTPHSVLRITKQIEKMQMFNVCHINMILLWGDDAGQIFRWKPEFNDCKLSMGGGGGAQRQLRYIEWKGVKIYDFQKVTFSTLFKLYIAGLGVLISKSYHMWG